MRVSRVIALIASLGVIVVPVHARVTSFRVAATTGDQAPGQELGVVYTGFRQLVLNNLGQVAFNADLAGTFTTSFNDRAIVTESGPDGPITIARKGSIAPGIGSGVRYFGLGLTGLGDDGETIYSAILDGGGFTPNSNANSASRAIFRGRGLDDLDPLAFPGGQAPGAALGTVVSGVGTPVANAASEVAFVLSVDGPDVAPDERQAVFSDVAATPLAPFARSGDQATGLSPDITIASITEPRISGAGRIAFRAELQGVGVTDENGDALYTSDAAGGRTLIAREGDQASGFNAGVRYRALTPPSSLSDTGDLLFRARLTGEGVTSENDSALFIASGASGVDVLARAGDRPPGVEEGVTYASLSVGAVGDHGAAIFTAELGGNVDASNNTSLFLREAGGDIRVLARDGGEAIGFPEGSTYSFFSPFIEMNGAGQAAFTAFVDDSDNANGFGLDAALYATDLDGELLLIAAEGQHIDVDPDPAAEDLRTISQLSDWTLNDAGDIAFQAFFTDGMQALLVARVPAPGSAALAGLVLLGARRRR